MRTVTADDLRRLVTDILLAVGADEANADRGAEGLVSANLCGVDPHLVFHLRGYVAAIKAGFIVPEAKPEIIDQTPATA